MNKDVGFRWYSGSGEEDDDDDKNNNWLHQLGGSHYHQAQPSSASTTTSNSDVFSFWSEAIQPPLSKKREQQQQQQEYNASMVVTCVSQVLDTSCLNVDYLDPTQTYAVVTTGEGSSQGRGLHQINKPVRSTHNVSEKRRRDRFNEKIRTLKELLPDCHKKDPVSVLDKVIQEIQLLKIQAQLLQEQYMNSTIRVPPTQTNVVGMVNYPAMQLLRYPGISPMPMPMLPFLPLGHTTITSSIATTEPGGQLLGSAQLQEGDCTDDRAGSSAGGTAKDAQQSRSTEQSS